MSWKRKYSTVMVVIHSRACVVECQYCKVFRLRALTALAPQMNTVNVTSFVRLAGNDELGVIGEGVVQVFDIVDMVGVRMVRIEPLDAREISRKRLGGGPRELPAGIRL
ncbi:hypothetical protein HYQ46_008124 [Verticillium longisporum]|nr:hypothetical protein HYQ46_008124 [Verticillium longisporum]